MEWIEITSRQNAAVKTAASLRMKKNRDALGLFLLEGFTFFADLVEKGIEPEAVFVSADKTALMEKTAALLQNSRARAYRVLPFVFEKLTEEKGSEGIVSLYSNRGIGTLGRVEKFGKLIALENVQDPGNVGAILRCAAALGFDGAFTVSGADPYSPRALRAGAGGTFQIPVQSFSSSEKLIAHLKEHGVKIYGATLHEKAVLPAACDFGAPFCIALGNEGGGLSEAFVQSADEKVMIPMQNVESLNVASAAAILMWEAVR